jgi:hypothetical protein
MVQPVAVTAAFMLEGYAIREYKRTVQGGSADATEVLCVMAPRWWWRGWRRRVRASDPEIRFLRGIGGRLRRN